MERPEPRLSREEIAKREIGRTDISPTLAWAMVAVFLATIVAVPTIQSIQEIRGGGSSASDSRWPSWCGIASAFDGVAGIVSEDRRGPVREDPRGERPPAEEHPRVRGAARG